MEVRLKVCDFASFSDDVLEGDGFMMDVKKALLNSGFSIDKTLLMRDLSYIYSNISASSAGKSRLVAKIKVVNVSELSIPFSGLGCDRRALRIKKRLEKGFAPQPLYFFNGNLVQGKHRLIAFDWQGLEKVIVVEINEA